MQSLRALSCTFWIVLRLLINFAFELMFADLRLDKCELLLLDQVDEGVLIDLISINGWLLDILIHVVVAIVIIRISVLLLLVRLVFALLAIISLLVARRLPGLVNFIDNSIVLENGLPGDLGVLGEDGEFGGRLYIFVGLIIGP